MKKVVYTVLALVFISTSTFTMVSCDGDDAPVSSPSTDDSIPEESTPNNPVQKSQLEVTFSSGSVYIGKEVTLSATLDDEDVTSSATFYVDDSPIDGNVYSSDSAGVYLINATHPDAEDSEYSSLKVSENPFNVISGTGTFAYNEVEKTIDKSALYYVSSTKDEDGNYLTDIWYIFAFNGESPQESEDLLAIRVEAIVTDQNAYALPTTSETIYSYILGAKVGGEVIPTSTGSGEDIEYLTGEANGYSGVVNYSLLDWSQSPTLSVFDIQISGQNNYAVSYDGTTVYSQYQGQRLIDPNGNQSVERVQLPKKEQNEIFKSLISK